MPVVETETVADLIEYLGVPPERIKMRPLPGTATEKDVIMARPLCELIDGVLVEKAMGYYESYLAILLGTFLTSFVRERNLGIVAGPDGLMRLFPGLIRIPDISFVSWARLPGGRLPRDPIAPFAPDLAVEVLSPSNTRQEMERKLQDYFSAGVQLVWYVDPVARTLMVYTAVDRAVLLRENQTLAGGAVVPGFLLPLVELFADPGQAPSPTA